MASRNSTLFLGLIVAISAITAAAPSNAIVISFDPLSITDMIVIRGIVPCGINVTLSPNGTVPPFPIATVQQLLPLLSLAATPPSPALEILYQGFCQASPGPPLVF
ncbi:hypothetical protein DCAR_0623733 [Daucus carota subsp. sativus]|uniref:Uncharacterized protein n=1 Tax=Daucus carota subsp. sativus TaxID=79200 RepID=A0AAF1B2M4_DAUCS|nr:hypothetical protein DCAR_0623733 [Daucus carota subsp. sativus]